MRWTPLLLGVLACLMPAVGWADDGALAGEVLEGVAQSFAGDETSTSVRLIVVLTTMSFLPAMLLATTPFTRFIIVFSLMRQALGLQQTPPNQVLVGLSLFLSMVVMQPTISQVNAEAVEPYLAGELETMEAYEAGITPMREFMMRNVRSSDWNTVLYISRTPRPASYDALDDVPTPVIVSAFLLSELKSAFIIGVQIYIPFLVADLVAASVLLGMGMMMLPPVVVSLPFKLMLFVLMDGWALLVTGLVQGYAS